MLNLVHIWFYDLVLGKFSLVQSQAILPDRRPNSPILDTIFGTGTGTAMDRLYWSGPSPDCIQTVPAHCIYLFIQDRGQQAHVGRHSVQQPSASPGHSAGQCCQIQVHHVVPVVEK